MTLGIVIPTLGRRPEDLRRCVAAAIDAAGHDCVLVTTPHPGSVSEILAATRSVRIHDDRGARLPESINAGFRALPEECDVVTFIGDDDWHLPRVTSEHAARLSRASGALIYAPAVVLWQPSGKRRVVAPGSRALWHLAAGINLLRQPACLYGRAALQRIGGIDESLTLAFDCDLHLRLAEVGEVLYSRTPSAVEVEHPGRLSTEVGVKSRGELERVARAARRRGHRRPPASLSWLRGLWAWHEPLGPRRADAALSRESRA